MKPTSADLANTVSKALGARIATARHEDIDRMAAEFFRAYAVAKISFRPAGEIAADRDATANAAHKAAALQIALGGLSRHAAKAITYAMREFENSESDEVRRFLKSLTENLHRLSDGWKKENDRHRSADAMGKLLANWSINFYEATVGERATATNAHKLATAIFKLFEGDVQNRSAANCLRHAINASRRRESLRAARRAA